jgi:tetratricopeptide (TPR) repeat protein
VEIEKDTAISALVSTSLLPREPAELMKLADEAATRLDWPTVACLWEALHSHFPDEPFTFTRRAEALRNCGQFDEADTILRVVIERFPQMPGPFADFAHVAVVRKDRPEAIRRWELVRRRFPSQIDGYTIGSIVLREEGRLREAEAVLLEAMCLFPDSPDPLVEHAWLAHVARDWDQAIERWRKVRAVASGRIVAYTMAAHSLQMLGREKEAFDLLDQATRLFPDDPTPVVEMAKAATREGVWEAAAQLWTELIGRFPDRPDCYSSAAHAMIECGHVDEAHTILSAMEKRFPNDPRPVWELAWLSFRRRDWAEAVPRWTRARQLFPDRVDCYILAARSLSAMWRYEEAEQLIEEAMKRFPDKPEPFLEYSRVAREQNNSDDALTRVMQVTSLFPGTADGWLEAARMLLSNSQLNEGEQLLTEGMRRCPDNPWLVFEFAQLPASWRQWPNQNWPETLRRMEQLRARFPTFDEGYVVGARNLREAQQPDASEQLAKDGCEKFPRNREMAILYARAPEHRSDWPEVARRFAQARDRAPNEPEFHAGLAQALAASDRYEEAEAVTRAMVTRFPGSPASFATHAEIATIKQDWPEAFRRWTEAAGRFPDEKEFTKRAYAANARSLEMDAHDRAAFLAVTPAPKPDPTTIDQNLREMAMQFTSLGGHAVGCEFGIFQRMCGAEPLDLLRWADMPFDKLIFCLNSRFEGVGGEEHTELIVVPHPDGKNEYCTQDRRGMMNMHSFVYDHEITFDKMYAASCRRLRYLSGKLIDDLEKAEKIFVYRWTKGNLTADQIDLLETAVRQYGNSTILYVCYSDITHPNGSVEILRPGLMIGYMERFMDSPEGRTTPSPAVHSWLAVCKSAYTLWSREA